MEKITILVCILLLISLIVIIILTKKANNDTDKNHNKNMLDADKEAMPPWLSPKKFDVDVIEYTGTANLCNNKVLYPINSIDVDYGSKVPDNLSCLEFIKAP